MHFLITLEFGCFENEPSAAFTAYSAKLLGANGNSAKHLKGNDNENEHLRRYFEKIVQCYHDYKEFQKKKKKFRIFSRFEGLLFDG